MTKISFLSIYNLLFSTNYKDNTVTTYRIFLKIEDNVSSGANTCTNNHNTMSLNMHFIIYEYHMLNTDETFSAPGNT